MNSDDAKSLRGNNEKKYWAQRLPQTKIRERCISRKQVSRKEGWIGILRHRNYFIPGDLTQMNIPDLLFHITRSDTAEIVNYCKFLSDTTHSEDL